MPVKKGQTLELTISDMAFGGKGIAKIDGYTVFVDSVVDQDVVLAKIVKKKKNFAEARVVERLAPSPHRIEPPCEYSGVCGGCKWQFIRYERQLIYKQQHVAECLKHIGQIQDVPVHPTVPSQEVFHYRNKMEFSCSDRRWLPPEEFQKDDTTAGIGIGLHIPGTFSKVLDIQSCLLQPDVGNKILRDFSAYVRNSHLPVYGLVSHQGFWRFLMLRHSVAYDQWMINILTASEDRRSVMPFAESLRRDYPNIVSVMNNITSRRSGVAVGDYEVLLAGVPKIREKIGEFEFEISANSFFQTHTRAATKLYDIARTYAELTGNETVLDLYSGTGTIAICISKDAHRVIGIEVVESAVADAIHNCSINGIHNCRFIQGDIKDTLAGLSETPDVIIIDPPRVGMHEHVVKQIIDRAPKRIVYVSCNPATLARDLGMLKNHFRVVEVQPVDMFPHTYHVESVAKLVSISV